MRKDSTGSILTKLGALVAFGAFIIGGGYLMYNGYGDEEWTTFALGSGMLAVGFFLIGVLGQFIIRYDRDGTIKGLSPLDCVKAGLLIMFIASSIAFLGVSIFIWIDRDLWQIGIAGIAEFAIMLIIAIEISIDFQTNGATKRVMKDTDATEHKGVIVGIEPRFPIILFFKKIYMIYRYTVQINDAKSSAFLKRGNKLRRMLDRDARVTVKFNPEKPRNCAILDVCDAADEPAESD